MVKYKCFTQALPLKCSTFENFKQVGELRNNSVDGHLTTSHDQIQMRQKRTVIRTPETKQGPAGPSEV